MQLSVKGAASRMATYGMTGQESAEAIVGAGSSLVAELETSLAKRGRTHPTEGPNMLQGRLPNEFPEHVESDRRSEHGARHGSTQPE